jgi:hypothetical protein
VDADSKRLKLPQKYMIPQIIVLTTLGSHENHFGMLKYPGLLAIPATSFPAIRG